MSIRASENRLIIVSNRLPIVLTQNENGEWQVQAGSGGLVTALAPVLQNRGGIWIGWSGNVQEECCSLRSLLDNETKKFGYTLKSVNLTTQDKENYYDGFANEIIWPLFHDFAAHCNFNPEYWFAYQQVNHKFARVIKQNARKNDFIGVHDYHL
ncbi:MAG: trehalose-6-phosphate synthase, partial [bacterium]